MFSTSFSTVSSVVTRGMPSFSASLMASGSVRSGRRYTTMAGVSGWARMATIGERP